MNSYEDPVGSIAQYRLVIGDDFPSRDVRNIRIVRDNTGTVVWEDYVVGWTFSLFLNFYRC